VEFEQEHDWSFGLENTLDRFKLHGYLQLKNLWNAHLNLKNYYNIFDTRELRGGPNLRKDGYNDVELFVQSNSVKDLFVGFGPRFRFFSDKISKTEFYTAYLRWQINDRFSITSRTTLDNSVDHHQFVTRTKNLSSETKYLVGTIDRKTISSTLRFEYYFSPEISLQYYGNPYASIGKYANFREVADASNKDLNLRYNALNHIPRKDNYYSLQKDGVTTYTIKNPDFNFQELNSNLVGRWEFRPGSTLYLVWTNSRSAYSDQLNQSIWKSFGNIWNVNSQNVFMIKFSYWVSL
jgi:hypothetical protein